MLCRYSLWNRMNGNGWRWFKALKNGQIGNCQWVFKIFSNIWSRIRFYHFMCNLQATYELKNGNVDNQENIVLDILLSSCRTRVWNMMVNTINYNPYLLLVIGRKSYMTAGDWDLQCWKCIKPALRNLKEDSRAEGEIWLCCVCIARKRCERMYLRVKLNLSTYNIYSSGWLYQRFYWIYK